MNIIRGFDRNYVFDHARHEACEGLYDAANDWRIQKPATSAAVSNTIESYAVDCAHIGEIPRHIIANCLNQLQHAVQGGNRLLELDRNYYQNHPVECAFFMRIFERKRVVVGKALAHTMNPNFGDARLQRIWDHTMNVTSMPPAYAEFDQYREQWQELTLNQTHQELQAAFDEGAADNSLETFGASDHHKTEISQERTSALWQLLTSLFSWRRIVAFFQ